MNKEKFDVIKNRLGFVAAMDQSVASSGITLERYGVFKDSYNSEEEMLELIHDMRKRILCNSSFNSDYIIGVILFYNTMNSKIDDDYVADYLWDKKRIPSFLKIDSGLSDRAHGVCVMKDFVDVDKKLELAKERGIVGTKMRSVIYEADEEGIKAVVKQQFEYAKIICDNGFIPIIEPEVDINAADKELCEEILKREIVDSLNNWNMDDKILFKFTIPSVDNFYLDLYDYDCVVKVFALSGGYDIDVAVSKLSNNKNMVASFSRALTEGLNVNQTDEEFSKVLESNIVRIYNASIK